VLAFAYLVHFGVTPLFGLDWLIYFRKLLFAEITVHP
jgi:hypothetical protein